MHVHGTKCGGCGENPTHQASSERLGLTFTLHVYQTREALPVGRACSKLGASVQ